MPEPKGESEMASPVIRVLLADDSPTMRRALLALLSPDPRLEVIGAARDGFEVLQMARFLKPDVISMDVRMPKLDGLEATRRILEEGPCRIVIVSSQGAEDETGLSFNAICAGAAEVFGKPTAKESAHLGAWGKKLADLLVQVGRMPLRPAAPRGSDIPLPGPVRRAELEIFGLAASTGGPPVLREILGALGSGLPVPLLVAQHIAEGFTGAFQKWLSGVSPLPVEMAREGESPRPGRVYLPPDGRHLEMEGKLFRTPRSSGGYCPSGDRLLASLARSFSAKAGGAVLTGMGEDGGRGLLELRRAGGTTLCQEPSSCAVYGMPRFADELGAAELSLSPEKIALYLRRACRPGAPDQETDGAVSGLK